MKLGRIGCCAGSPAAALAFIISYVAPQVQTFYEIRRFFPSRLHSRLFFLAFLPHSGYNDEENHFFIALTD
ncbi:MAG: hypothetical protein K2P33_03685 [Acutalibacter sp.]|nr:hypothetical protein [Acutalibacter sp.]